ncbi:cytochrome b/b6 domain-containing protein [Cereibacter azotoformans]|uniref:cytochrome b/b6 domain-containing protein n=1 Tax=Cereibacter azotoformans TaxID=43057 RepID=UPI000C6EEA90|nr:cytochrome b/b6 domain-containing protein [Cereibacter azotoformans]
MISSAPTRAREVTVWDPAVRIFHWTLAASIGWEMLAEAGTDSHEAVGYLVLALVLFRLAWGFLGPRHARFADFVARPARVLGYLAEIARGHPRRYLGHNPAGGAMVLALLASVAATAASGWAMTTDALWGAEWIEDLHETLANATVALVALHVAGVLLAGIQHRENLVRAMVTGRKPRG